MGSSSKAGVGASASSSGSGGASGGGVGGVGRGSVGKLAKEPLVDLSGDLTAGGMGTEKLLGGGESQQEEEDDDCCATCLEMYTQSNPRIWTQCGHHFHMQCIYEWLERKETCPLCESEIRFEEL
ncbi:E3 ubiquitin-protein ligase [Monoraphidium neglectum]|uniref:RING-type E3 ubiquitin transferase n=1 Tax=Monoraphidium neglectum TaxID=145388 RepID=A0A0D2K9B1_9CHLO|nr:E3 ubiquitin-protein ligase [Monoraphidium neglectum]KIZ06803.1 E3 ubiquitin-protein ligase [Monoraphidium neglectum]|eukprot:XP_013905822.1 E3 ubiquitin-protein ligase [Monoraphidium neglectum]